MKFSQVNLTASATFTPMIEIVPYAAEHQPWFEKLNREWIEKYFWMEPVDFDVLQHPDQHIVAKGGTILMALCDKEIAGTVALKFVEPGIYEFTKMAVHEKFRGRKIGLALAEAAIEKAKALGAYKIILYSNTVLAPAIALYRKLGFVEIPVDATYERSNIKMERWLTTHLPIKIRNATIADAEAIAKLGIKTFHDTFAPHNRESDMNLYLEKSFAPGQMAQELSDPYSTFLLANDGEELAGYAKLRVSEIPAGLNAVRPLEIERIYVRKEYIGRKVGKLLMEACLALARKQHHDCVWLGVWENNTKAITFYEKWGFEKFGTHPFILGTDVQTDFLMKKDLNV